MEKVTYIQQLRQLQRSGVTLTMFTIRLKKRKKKEKKGRHYFFGFSYRLLAPPGAFWRPLKLFGAPGAFCTPKYFFPHHRTLIWPTYGTFLQPNNFNSKFWRPLLMATGATLRHCSNALRFYQKHFHNNCI